ncbi:RteC domain-containing protein [Carboxylicivirga mesophila]|uniref:RteC domain-containing protein n=1 Tax=Carboxylicivirga mesophila TaxID=1166478 RepID=A0ABS5K6W6_9BACT|nr:RteC domain-containing protein [Carboxylicivirga mesophila]MBS2210725.1 RteC domain-containing protein [Carboxylicivirga mesophila]
MNEAYIQIAQALETQLAELQYKEQEPLLLMEEAIGLIIFALLEMKEQVLIEGFNCSKSEVNFFKEVKPRVYGQLIYYLKLMKVETLRLALANDGQVHYLSSTIKELEQYYIKHADLYRYYRLNMDYMDEQYFLRTCNSEVKDFDHIHQMLDAQFTTAQDQVWATFIAHEQLIRHLESELTQVKQGRDKRKLDKYQLLEDSSLSWTDSKVALVELIYAMHSARSVNDGRFEIKKMVRLFELIFNIELSDAYRVYINIRNRKIERTRYLDHLKQSLINRMDEQDNKDINNA